MSGYIGDKKYIYQADTYTRNQIDDKIEPTVDASDVTPGRLLRADHGVNLGGDQTINGVKAFTSKPNVNGDDIAVMANVGPITNFDAATGTVTIPSGLAVGTRRLIRKIHPTQGTVTIECEDETFTRAGLASVELNADGDYWLLEKVTATRWELVDGWNTGENANGRWVRRANGDVVIRNTTPIMVMTDEANAFTHIIPAACPVFTIDNVLSDGNGSADWDNPTDRRRTFVLGYVTGGNSIGTYFGGISNDLPIGSFAYYNFVATGRWYA